jgi:nitric oxide reductase large subunit
MEYGTIFGHGAHLGPDFAADEDVAALARWQRVVPGMAECLDAEKEA